MKGRYGPYLLDFEHAPVAQLDRASDFESVYRPVVEEASSGTNRPFSEFHGLSISR